MRYLIVLAAMWCGACAKKERPAAAPAPIATEKPGSLDLGPGLFPPVVSGIRLGMDRRALKARRPRAYASRPNPNLFHETLASNLSAHYTFHRGRLYSVLLREFGGAKRSEALAAMARRRWGKPSRIETARLYRAGEALVRIDRDLGNLILEVTADPPKGRPTK